MSATAREKGIDVAPLAPLVQRIVRACRPVQIWLFGSRARGEARLESDWDLLIVMPDSTVEGQLHPLVAWRLCKDAEVPAEAVMCWAREFEEDRGTVNTLAYEVDRDGVLLYER